MSILYYLHINLYTVTISAVLTPDELFHTVTISAVLTPDELFPLT